MKIKFTILFFSIFSLLVSINAQPGKNKSVITDEFGKTCSEDVMERFDNFMDQVEGKPGSSGYIVFYGDASSEGKNLLFIKYLTKVYPQKKNFDTSKINLVRGKNQKKLKIQFWIVPPGANPPEPEEKLNEMDFSKTVRFDFSRVEQYPMYSELNIYDENFLDFGCNFPPNLIEFARILKENRNLYGFLKVYGSNSEKTKNVVKFFQTGLVEKLGVSQNQVKTVYAGKRKDPQIEFWLVPKGKR